MSATARLSLPYIAPQQAQKQVTYNAAMALLDQLVQPAVVSRTTTTPPASPTEGVAYLVAPSSTGAWAGMDGRFACWLSGAWSFRAPANGWLAYIADTSEIAICQSGVWQTLVSNGGASVAKFGVNATADLTNRLAVAADASLFTHNGTSHRMTINKATSSDTASLLFKDNYSGRAELGLTGDDAFHVKVSPNGSSWYEALTVAQGTGLVTLPIGQLALPATQNASSGANTFDDYEEGSWTPSITFGGGSTGMTYTSQVGTYTKIGNTCLPTCNVVLLTKGSSTGTAACTGLPFMPGSPSNAIVNNNSGTMSGLTAGMIGQLSSGGGTTINFRPLASTGTGGTSSVSNSTFVDTSAVLISMPYITSP